MLRVRLVFWYMLWCLRFGARPWRYFQLNAPWFSDSRRIFSKREMDELIPPKWRLTQEPLRPDSRPSSWPVFLKPEWGQNARGILVAEDQQSFDRSRRRILSGKLPYLFQEAATGAREFEIFYIRDGASGNNPAVFSITETLNSSNLSWPVNGILNQHTSYKTLTRLTTSDEHRLWQHLEALPAFRIARIGLRTDSIEDMLEGKFRIIEINLFVPLPLHLLDESVSLQERRRFIRVSMRKLAQSVKALPLSQPRKNIFWPMLLLSCQIRR
ncbi:hypothetical protein [Thiolapillus sp.]